MSRMFLRDGAEKRAACPRRARTNSRVFATCGNLRRAGASQIDRSADRFLLGLPGFRLDRSVFLRSDAAINVAPQIRRSPPRARLLSPCQRDGTVDAMAFFGSRRGLLSAV